MNREDIIRMAREAGIEWDLIDEDEGQIWYINAEGLQRFAQLVSFAEREACAQVCESDDSMRWAGAAEAIRARGKK